MMKKQPPQLSRSAKSHTTPQSPPPRRGPRRTKPGHDQEAPAGPRSDDDAERAERLQKALARAGVASRRAAAAKSSPDDAYKIARDELTMMGAPAR